MRRVREQWEREAPTSSKSMSEEEWHWWLMVEWQADRCAICGGLGLRGVKLVTDHDHKTGMVRGLLCIRCNAQEGRLDLPVFVKYRQRNPASICGLRMLYYNYFTQQYAEPQLAR